MRQIALSCPVSLSLGDTFSNVSTNLSKTLLAIESIVLDFSMGLSFSRLSLNFKSLSSRVSLEVKLTVSFSRFSINFSKISFSKVLKDELIAVLNSFVCRFVVGVCVEGMLKDFVCVVVFSCLRFVDTARIWRICIVVRY